jgi:hypothetical protein
VVDRARLQAVRPPPLERGEGLRCAAAWHTRPDANEQRFGCDRPIPKGIPDPPGSTRDCVTSNRNPRETVAIAIERDRFDRVKPEAPAIRLVEPEAPAIRLVEPEAPAIRLPQNVRGRLGCNGRPPHRNHYASRRPVRNGEIHGAPSCRVMPYFRKTGSYMSGLHGGNASPLNPNFILHQSL